MPKGAIGKMRKGLNPTKPPAAPVKPAEPPLGPANLLGRAPRLGTGPANLIGALGGRRKGKGAVENA